MASDPLSFAGLDFAITPFLAIWETTQACPLTCRHCRAEARPDRDPNELTTAEGRDLLAQIKAMGTPVCVLSGGDPLRRPDLPDLVRAGRNLGLRMATIPVTSEDLTREKLADLKEAGLAQVAFSLDGSTAERHDNFRQVGGTYARAIQAVEWAHELDLPVQINTALAECNFDDLDNLIALVKALDIVFWEVFSLVPVGRGSVLAPLTGDDHEVLFAKLHALSTEVPFIIKVTEAPHYRRYVLQQRAREIGRMVSSQSAGSRSAGRRASHLPAREASHSAIPAQLARELTTAESFGSHGKGINAGKGFCFVSHTGEVFPSGFLPVSVGNVRDRTLAEMYRDSELFRQLRDPALLRGRCGICEFADVCGGSRSRAYAVTGDYLAEDPACIYQPAPRCG